MSSTYKRSDNHFRMRWVVLLIALVFSASTMMYEDRVARAYSGTPTPEKYYLRVSGCDDGGKAYIDGTLIVDVGFDEDSNWLDVTEDVARESGTLDLV